MNKYLGHPLSLTAKANRERLAKPEREAVMEETAKKASAVRENMARLRELRLAKEANEVRTEISAGNQSPKAKSRKRPR
jgi:hypothetical protein